MSQQLSIYYLSQRKTYKNDEDYVRKPLIVNGYISGFEPLMYPATVRSIVTVLACSIYYN
jgi:hypothetical protein